MKKKIMMSLLVINSLLYSTDLEIPHEIIYENPKRETKIIESKKLRDKAEMDITVTKVDIEEINGIKLKDNCILFKIPQEKIKKEYDFNVVKHLNTNSLKKDNKFNIQKLDFKHEINENQDLIKLNMENTDEIYIVKTEKNTKNIVKLFKGKLGNIKSTINIGNMTFIMDSRIKSLKEQWIDKFGKIRDSISDTNFVDYSEIINISGGLKNLPSSGVTGDTDGAEMLGRTYKDINGNYGLYSPYPTIGNDVGAIITGRDLNTLADYVMVSTKNGDNPQFLNNEFTIKGKENGVFYSGNIIENYINKSFNVSEATLNITGFKKDGTATWKPNSISGSPEYGSIGPILNISADGKLFDTTSIKERSIVNKLVVVEDGVKTEILGDVNSNISYIGIHNDISILSNGKFQVKKKSLYSDLISYNITPYYNNLKLGELKIKIKNENEKPKYIGKVIFEFDKRIKKITFGEWIDFQGNIQNKVDDTFFENYKEFVNTSEIFDPRYSKVQIEKYFKVDNYSVVESGSGDWEYYRTNTGEKKDLFAVYRNIKLENLLEKIRLSKNNSSGISFLNNKFNFLNNNGIVYNGDIEEIYKGEDAQIASATLNLGNIAKGEFGEWSPNVTGEAISGKVKMNIITGKLFDIKGINGYSIADKLIVQITGGLEETVTGAVNTPISYTGTDNSFTIYPDGKLRITKNSDNTDEIHYKLIPCYKDIVLGELNITIKNKQPITIEGGDILDFGDVVQGDQAIATSILKVKDLPGGNSIKITTETNIEMTHTKVEGKKIPVTLETGLIKKDSTTEIGLRGTINTKLDDSAGQYEGITNLLIIIE